MFNSLSSLKKQLLQRELLITHSGNAWLASFEWFPPAHSEQIRNIEYQLSLSLPKDYKEFLGEISNGAVLFCEKEYNQWGFRLFGTTEIIEQQEKWRKSIPFAWNANLVAFGELFGESSVLVFDLDRPTKDFLSYAVLEGNAYDKFSDWAVLSSSLSNLNFRIEML